MKQNLPEQLRKIRVLRNLSQEYIAEQLKVSLSSYSRYESGKAKMDFKLVAKLADFYKITVDELINFSTSNKLVEEPKEKYGKTMRMNVMVELDGNKVTLDKWIDKLKAINDLL